MTTYRLMFEMATGNDWVVFGPEEHMKMAHDAWIEWAKTPESVAEIEPGSNILTVRGHTNCARRRPLTITVDMSRIVAADLMEL